MRFWTLRATVVRLHSSGLFMLVARIGARRVSRSTTFKFLSFGGCFLISSKYTTFRPVLGQRSLPAVLSWSALSLQDLCGGERPPVSRDRGLPVSPAVRHLLFQFLPTTEVIEAYSLWFSSSSSVCLVFFGRGVKSPGRGHVKGNTTLL